MSDFLDKIVTVKRRVIAETMTRTSLDTVRTRARARREFRSLATALAAPGVRVIAEIKRASPSRGPIRPGLDPAALARAYAAGGAAAVSVLTERDHFQGSDDDLMTARAAMTLPVLRKDFVLDAYQVYEAAAIGADAVLLIVRILDDPTLANLYALALELGLDPLVEVFSDDDAARARRLKPRLIGINNRDLRFFGTSTGNAPRLAGSFAEGTIVVAASGIRNRADIDAAQAAGIRCFLVGESLVRAQDPAAHLASLLRGGGA
ncbi:MAG: indole-3-glycerol phosphate synthase TrpC [Kiritimatiellae bacterium]|nr:indole-3-glycerol phosphate synthase TrpC [Kiritimatiellia bacterium]